MFKTVTIFAAGALSATILTGTGLAVATTTGDDHPDPVHGKDIPTWVIRPCKSQDSVNCRWNAKTQGNGKGHSYIVRQFPGSAKMVCVMYVESRYAKSHDYCEATR